MKEHFTIKQANSLFVILALVFLTLGAYVQSRSIISGLLITEYGILLMPILLFSVINKIDIKSAFRLKKIPFKVAFKVIVLSLLLIPTVALVNLVILFFIELFSSSITMPIPTAQSGWDYLVLFFVIAVSAGICEEFFFRGMILDAYQNETNLLTAAVWSAIFFGIFHFNPQNLLGPIVLGLVYAYLVQMSGSIWTGVIGHIANNGIAVSMGFVLNFTNDAIGEEMIETAQGEMLFESMGVLVGVIVFYAVLAVVCMIGVKHLLKSIKKHYPRYDIGDTLSVKGRNYTILNREDDKVFMKPTLKLNDETEPVMASDISMLESVHAVSQYKLWSGQKLKWGPATVLPLSIVSVLYGVIIYVAYIKEF